MSAAVVPFPRPLATAYIESLDGKWRITFRNSPVMVVRHIYKFDCEDESAEFAVALRDHGGWTLVFGPGAASVRVIVAEIDGAAA